MALFERGTNTSGPSPIPAVTVDEGCGGAKSRSIVRDLGETGAEYEWRGSDNPPTIDADRVKRGFDLITRVTILSSVWSGGGVGGRPIASSLRPVEEEMDLRSSTDAATAFSAAARTSGLTSLAELDRRIIVLGRRGLVEDDEGGGGKAGADMGAAPETGEPGVDDSRRAEGGSEGAATRGARDRPKHECRVNDANILT